MKSNRGFVFIPEVGDHVLVGFRHGAPNRSYVMGSLFNGTTGAGGFAENHKKSLTTRSGSTITFDDSAHTILLQTTHANKIFVDEKNGTIAISSAEEVKVVSTTKCEFT
ncbi:phage baseplate assembly protein V [Segatella oris]|uniref:phage baseplate assembly protein V n=1 Tax=Segatella oris TaxID=28135 RepID=UPI00360B209C